MTTTTPETISLDRVYDLFASCIPEHASVARYLSVNAAEYGDQVRHYGQSCRDAAARGDQAAVDTFREASMLAAAKRDAYADALRVLDIATDAMLDQTAN
jgi:hypothetical protein